MVFAPLTRRSAYSTDLQCPSNSAVMPAAPHHFPGAYYHVMAAAIAAGDFSMMRPSYFKSLARLRKDAVAS